MSKEYCSKCGFEFRKVFPIVGSYEKYCYKDGTSYCFNCAKEKLNEEKEVSGEKNGKH